MVFTHFKRKVKISITVRCFVEKNAHNQNAPLYWKQTQLTTKKAVDYLLLLIEQCKRLLAICCVWLIKADEISVHLQSSYIQFQYTVAFTHELKCQQDKPDGCQSQTADRYASTGKVHLVSLWPWPLTLKCNWFIFIQNCKFGEILTS